MSFSSINNSQLVARFLDPEYHQFLQPQVVDNEVDMPYYDETPEPPRSPELPSQATEPTLGEGTLDNLKTDPIIPPAPLPQEVLPPLVFPRFPQIQFNPVFLMNPFCFMPLPMGGYYPVFPYPLANPVAPAPVPNTIRDNNRWKHKNISILLNETLGENQADAIDWHQIHQLIPERSLNNIKAQWKRLRGNGIHTVDDYHANRSWIKKLQVDHPTIDPSPSEVAARLSEVGKRIGQPVPHRRRRFKGQEDVIPTHNLS